MFSWFIRNRKGSITIMISALLIAVLSMSSTLIEIAKYRSMERVFKEAEENAAFSVLSQYDFLQFPIRLEKSSWSII